MTGRNVTTQGCSEPRDTADRQPARPLKVIVDEHGCPWLCDASANPTGDLAAQGCWRCAWTAPADAKEKPPEENR